MNANELADAMQGVISVLNVHHEEDCLFIANEAQFMLRQQQLKIDNLLENNARLDAEIEVLKSEIVSIEKNTDYWFDKSNWIPIQKPETWEGGEEWEKLAWELCADEHGEESCTDLIWDMGVIPEPWGDRWQKYEDEAKRMIYMVRKCTHPVKELTDEEIWEIFTHLARSPDLRTDMIRFADSILRKAQEK